MPTGANQYDAAADAAACHLLGAAAGAATQFAVYSLATGAFVPAGIAGLAAGVGAYAYAKNCTPWDPSSPGELPAVDGCQSIANGGWGTLQFNDGQGWANYIGAFGEYTTAQEIENIVTVDEFGTREMTLRSRSSTDTFICATSSSTQRVFRILPNPGESCGITSDGTQGKDYDYTDPDTGCTLHVTFQAWGAFPDNNVAPIFKIEPAAQTRSSGGIIGGCNFEPVIYYQPPGGGGGGKPPVYGPWNPDWDNDPNAPWGDFISALVGGVAALAADKALDELFKTNYPATSREIYAACENKADGTPETFSVNFPEESYQDRVLASLDAIVDFQQQILLWKTPTCATSSPKIGDYRTISFISDETSPNGKRRLPKRFRYRSSSGVGLDGVVEHWRSFTWSAGPVCVQHKGSQLGSPQVWAASIDEGKRVIRHAGAEAGIDPDSIGQWEVSGSDDPRYGMPGTMRVNTAGGYYWITSRLGPDQRPPVILT